MTELSLNILDIANNSTRAKAKNITVWVKADFKSDMLTLSVTDDGCGMSEEFVKKVSDPFSTTRTTRRVGMGIPLFKMAADMTGGNLEIVSKVGEGTTITATFMISHIDRAPLGDLADTMAVLIGGALQTDFVLNYEVDENKYVFCTREVKAVLGDSPLSEPFVLKYIKEMIQENIEIVNGGKTL